MAKHQHLRAATLSVTLPLEMAQAVFDRVRAGAFGSPGALIREAVRRLLEAEPSPAPPDDEAERPARRTGRRAPEAR
ncbi:MAG: hypothetical protein FJ265_04690 [Planctomycetes bacterium]|nr:hypothetical protein [Planctomycetota bacterium]